MAIGPFGPGLVQVPSPLLPQVLTTWEVPVGLQTHSWWAGFLPISQIKKPGVKDKMQGWAAGCPG